MFNQDSPSLTRSVLIAGYKMDENRIEDELTYIDHCDYDKIFKNFNKKNNNVPKIIRIMRNDNINYPNEEYDCFGYYVAYKYYTLPTNEILNLKSIAKIVNTSIQPLPEDIKKILDDLKIEISDFGIYTDIISINKEVEII